MPNLADPNWGNQASRDGAPSVLTRSLLRSQVKDVLVERIIAGAYPPGSRLVETQIARQLGVSQGSVREALRELESVGMVEYAPFRGTTVRQPTRSELLEAFPVRAALESLGAAEAAKRLDQKGLDRLAGSIADMEAAAANGDRHAHSVANARFHAMIVHAAGNPTLERQWRLLEPFARTYLTVARSGVDLSILARRHLLILEPLRGRDSSGAAEAMHHHLIEAAEWLKQGG